MDKQVEAFGRMLYRGDEAAVSDLQTALADFAPFYRRHGEAIGIDVDYLIKHFLANGPDPWGVLIDVGVLHKWAFEADWREFADEIAAGLRELVPARSLPVDWEAITEDDLEAEAVFAAVQAASRPVGEVLVVLDRGSDSYPLAFVPEKSLAEAQQLATAIGSGSVTIAEEQGK